MTAVSTTFVGKHVRIMMPSHRAFELIETMAPAFEEKTGIRVNFDMPGGIDILPKYLDSELSASSGAHDIVMMLMINIGHVIKVGWAADLMPLIRRDSFDLTDFVPGTLEFYRNNSGLFALPWLPDAMAIAYRKDLFAQAGIAKFPETFDELLELAPQLHKPDVSFFACPNSWHWIWPLFLQSFGGNFFARPPDDLTPTFNTAEAIKSAEGMVSLISQFGPPNALDVDIHGAQKIFYLGKVVAELGGMGDLQQAMGKESRVADLVAFAHVPKGPAGWFPQLAMQGYMIPSACKQKDVAWEVLKWLTSYEVEIAQAMELNHIACNRFSVLHDPKVRERWTGGETDVIKILEESIGRAQVGYMAYRLVPPFRAVGARVNVAFTNMLRGRAKIKDALEALQQQAMDILTQAGYLSKTGRA